MRQNFHERLAVDTVTSLSRKAVDEGLIVGVFIVVREETKRVKTNCLSRAMLGVTGILVHSFVDFNLQIPANAALFYVLCVIAAMGPRFSAFGRVHFRRPRPAESGELSG
jgi:hypothetical protein